MWEEKWNTKIFYSYASWCCGRWCLYLLEYSLHGVLQTLRYTFCDDEEQQDLYKSPNTVVNSTVYGLVIKRIGTFKWYLRLKAIFTKQLVPKLFLIHLHSLKQTYFQPTTRSIMKFGKLWKSNSKNRLTTMSLMYLDGLLPDSFP